MTKQQVYTTSAQMYIDFATDVKKQKEENPNNPIDVEWELKYNIDDLGMSELNASIKVFSMNMRGRFQLYQYYGNLDNMASELNQDSNNETGLLEEKVNYYLIHKEKGIEAAENYAYNILKALDPKMFEPEIMEGGLVITSNDADIYKLYNRINQYGNWHDFESEMKAIESSVKAQIGDIESENITISNLTYYGITDLFCSPVLEYDTNIDIINEYHKFVDVVIAKSTILQHIQKDINEINKYRDGVLNETQKVYRGCSVDEILKLDRHKGKVGYHKRGIGSMKRQDFVSTSVRPSIALGFTSHDFIPLHEGVLIEYDVSDLAQDEIKGVEYNLHGSLMQKLKRGDGIFWQTECFGGYLSPIFVQQAEVHIKNGSKPKPNRIWINPKLDEDKKEKIKNVLTKINPDVIIYEDSNIS